MPAIPQTLIQSKYDFRSRVFPLDLGQEDMNHYMVININVPSDIFDRNTPTTSIGDITRSIGERSKIDRLRFPDGVPGFPGWLGGNNNNRAIATLPRRTVRIAESIALHMPSPLVFNTQNMYEEISLTALAGKIGAAAVNTALTAIRGGGATPEQGLASGRAAGRLTESLTNFASGAAKIMQRPINPAVEILFATTALRQFTFEVLMAARNQKESEAIKEIIYALRYHSAPEVSGPISIGPISGGSGLFWIPPAEFDISFWNKGKENYHILGINTCVMERLEVDYSPSGIYSTFSNGHPVAVRLSMGFRELEPIHKARIRQGM
jgi:hypothetical protein